MRKRKWQTVLYIFLIFVLSYFYIHMHQLYFSPEDAFYACERGLRSGPSKEIILQHELEAGSLMLVGRQEEGLFVVPVEKTYLFFWRMQSGGVDGFFKCDKPLNGYQTYDGNYLGLCLDENITEFSILVGNYADRQWEELIYPIEGELIFEQPNLNWDDRYIVYTEGRNAAGEVVFKDGEEALMKVIRAGNYTYGHRVVTKPYPVAPNAE